MTAPKIHAHLVKDRQEHFNTRRGWFVNAYRLVDPETGLDLVQPWFSTRKDAITYAAQNNITIQGQP
jgi:hypothetical protein